MNDYYIEHISSTSGYLSFDGWIPKWTKSQKQKVKMKIGNKTIECNPFDMDEPHKLMNLMEQIYQVSTSKAKDNSVPKDDIAAILKEWDSHDYLPDYRRLAFKLTNLLQDN